MNQFARHQRRGSKLRYWLAGMALVVCSIVGAQEVPAPSVPAPATATSSAAPRMATTAPVRTLVAGRDYLVLAKRLPAPADRLEVTYFFWYNSPTSAKIDPLMRSWAATKASPLVKFRPMPAVLQNNWGYGARLFFALQQLNKEAVVGPKLLQALDQEIVDYNSPKSVSDWMRDQGVSLKDLSRAVNDPRVIAQTAWMPSLMKLYGVERVPTVVIDGQFLFRASADEKPEAFISRISFASEALTQRKLQEMAKQRKLKE